MLNGWTMKLLSPQASRRSVRKNRARLQTLSGFSCFAGRLDFEGRIRGRCSARLAARSSRGGICRTSDYVPAMAERQQRSGATTLRQLFEAEPDRLSRYTSEVAGIC